MNQNISEKFDSYPKNVKEKLLFLRELILATAAEIPELETVEETLKWGEPAYVSKIGSTVRIDWKKSKPDQYAMYFNCNSKLVDTFKELYRDELDYEGNRAIVFKLDSEVPINIIKHCILLSLTYHKIKHKPLLGA